MVIIDGTIHVKWLRAILFMYTHMYELSDVYIYVK